MKISNKLLFYASALYDGTIGIVFLGLHPIIYQKANIALPNHPGYIQFPALFLVFYAGMLYLIGKNASKYRDFIWIAIGIKLSYSGVVFYNQIFGSIPMLWVPFAIIDLLFAWMFLRALLQLRRS